MAVRREKVLLELEDRFSSGMLRAAAATQTLDKSLNSLDGSTVRTNRDMDTLGSSTGSLSKAAVQSRNASREIDRMSGRVRLLADAAVLLGPALIPIGAVGVPALAGLAAQFGAAAIAGATAIGAFQGVGTALEAVNKAALEPTTENLEAARMAMEQLSPAARDMVRQLQEMRPAMLALRDAAAAGMFPGLTAALEEMDAVLPRLEPVLLRIGGAVGEMGQEFAEGIAGPRGQEFLDFVGAEVPAALEDLGHITASVVAGMAELWMAFTPANRDFSSWLVGISRDFDQWASGLAQTEGFENFIAYIRENGPRVADAMGAIGNAVVQLVQAAAPLGGPTLAALEAFANVVSAIADSSYGPALVAVASSLILVSRAIKTVEAIKATSMFSALSAEANGAAGSMSKLQRAAAVGVPVLIAAAAAANALTDAFAEDLPGLEQLTGQLLSLSRGDVSGLGEEFDSLGESVNRIADPLLGESIVDNLFKPFGVETFHMSGATAEVEALDDALANLVAMAGPDEAEAAFRRLAESQNLTATETQQLLALLPQYQDALAGAANQADLAATKSEAAGFRAANGFRRAVGAAQAFRNAIEAANRALEGRASVRDYEQAIDDLTKSVRQNGKTLDTNTQKGRDNQAALDAIASSALKVSENMKGTNRVAFLEAARKDMIDAAQKLGMTRGEAAALADRLLGLDKIHANPSVTLMGVDQLMSEIGRINSSLDYASRARRTQITVAYAHVGRDTIGGLQSRAEGGTIYGHRYPYRDKVLAHLAPGEEVISNRYGQADKHRALLKAINANRYANGGTVAPSVSVAPPNVSVGGASVRVFLDGREIDARVESRISDHSVDAAERRPSYNYGSVG